MKRSLRPSRAQDDGGSGTGIRSGLWRRLSLFGLLVALPVLLLVVFTGGSGGSRDAGERTAAEGTQSGAGTRTETREQTGDGEHGGGHGGHPEAAAADKEGKEGSGDQDAAHQGHSASAGGKCAAKVKITTKGDDYRAKVTVTNSGETEIGNWMVHSSISPDANIEKHWRTVLSGYGLAVAFGNTDKNGTLEPGESTTFGFFVKNGTPPPSEANVCYVH
ncbi:cellulose binding domain-containing protein [Streptomyces xinghaiensis]|uniref:cellulose binding domain-containing protein n=1 Tax=Streptomyces xinghaiensis TaxID=1038928 RepID=UPI002E10CE4A|nr:cellulose binding domain-containing protein [Streptomyces xinghaiensis]